MEEVTPSTTTPEVTKISDEDNKRLDYFLGAPLRSANSLLNKLYPDDHFYQTATYAWVGADDAKKLFLYGVCHEVVKACISMMGDKEILQERPNKKVKGVLEKMIYGSIIDTQTQRIRKMIELLSLLILFEKNTLRDEEYRIYLSAENLDMKLSRQKEFKDFYEGEMVSNTQSSIKTFTDRIFEDLSQIGKTNIWFLDSSKVKSQQPSVFVSKRKIYLDALLVANDDEKLILGISYSRSYSRFSMSIHPLLGSHNYGEEENNYEHVMGNVSFLSLLCMHVMHTAYKITGIDDPEGIDKIMGPNFEKSDASKGMAAMKKSYESGDLILTAYGDLAEVVDKKTSRFGYVAYKVKYLSDAPLPEYVEDWLESAQITGALLRKGLIRAFYEKNTSAVKDEKLKAMMSVVLQQPDEKLLEYGKSTFLDLHKHGVLIPMLIKSGFLKVGEAEK